VGVKRQFSCDSFRNARGVCANGKNKTANRTRLLLFRIGSNATARGGGGGGGGGDGTSHELIFFCLFCF